MTVLILSAKEKAQLCVAYSTRLVTLESLAVDFRCSTSTVRNVLKEYGFIKPKPQVSAAQAALLAFVNVNHLNTETIRQALDKPEMNTVNVINYLNKLPHAQRRLIAAGTGFQLTETNDPISNPTNQAEG